MSLPSGYWLVKLLGYSFEIQYKPGLENKVADALSQIPGKAAFNAITTSCLLDVDQISKEVRIDHRYEEIIKKLQINATGAPPYSLHRGKLYYKNRLVLLNTSALIPTILHAFHNTVIGGHSGMLRTYIRIAGELFWSGMKADIKRYVESCDVPT